MLRETFRALLSHWRRHPLQLATLLVGLALATALWSAVQAINGEARASYARAAAVLGQDRLPSLSRDDGTRFGQETYIAIRKAGWLVAPLIEGEKRYGQERIRIIGIDPLTMPADAAHISLPATGGDLMQFITPPGLMVMSPETAARLKGQDTPPLRLTNDLPPGVAVTDIGIAQGLLGAEGQVSRLLVLPDQPLLQTPLEALPGGLTLRRPQPSNDLSRLTQSFHLNLTAFGFLSFAVGVFIVHAAVGLAFEQRRQMFRTLRAVGLPLLGLVAAIAAELLVLALLAGLAGVVLGYVIAAQLLPDVAASLKGLYGAELPGSLGIRPGVWVAGVAIAVAGTFASASAGLWRLWRLPLLDAARPRAWRMAAAGLIRSEALAGLALMVTAGLLTLFGHGLSAGFVAMGGLLLGAALLLPWLLSLLLSFGARRSKAVLAQWFWADTRQQVPGLSLAFMALLLALATNIGVGTMVSSFRQTFVAFLDQRLASELYVTARNVEESEAIRSYLQPRADAVLPIWNSEGRIGGEPVLIYGILDHATYRDNWPMLAHAPDVWDAVKEDRGVLVNEQLARRLSLTVGSPLALPEGPRLPVAGIFSDFGNPKGQVIVSNALLLRTYKDVNRLRYGVRIAPAKAPALANDLRSAFNLPTDAIIDQASIKAYSLKVFERTFAVTAALNVLTLGVAAVSILASLMTLAGMRLPQLAPVWAVGLPRRLLLALEVLRSVALALITFVMALPVGLGLAWLLLAVVNVEAFGWRLPMHLYPLQWLWLLGLALPMAALAALVPALGLARKPPAELLKVFAHER